MRVIEILTQQARHLRPNVFNAQILLDSLRKLCFIYTRDTIPWTV